MIGIKMTKAQFIAGCVMCGYCAKDTAKAYAAGKDELTDADFEIVHRIEQDKLSREVGHRQKFHDYQGTRSTKTGERLKMTGCGIGAE